MGHLKSCASRFGGDCGCGFAQIGSVSVVEGEGPFSRTYRSEWSLADSIERELDASEPRLPGGQHVSPGGRWNMVPSTRSALRRLIRDWRAQHGYHGTVPLSEASPSTQSEALKTTPSNSAPSLDHAITVPPSVEEHKLRIGAVMSDYGHQCRTSKQTGDYSGHFDKVRDYLDALVLAAVRSAHPPSQAWQPIETHDGSEEPVFGFDGTKRVTMKHVKEWADPWASIPGLHPIRPTHWMPLPSPPSQARQETEQEPLGGHESHGGRRDLEPAARPELPHDAPLLEWQVIRYGDSPETHAALAYYRERGWAVDDPNVHPNYDRVNDFISAFKSGYRAAIQKAEGR